MCDFCHREATHRNLSNHATCEVCSFSFSCRVLPALVGLVLRHGNGPEGGSLASIARERANIYRSITREVASIRA